MKERRVAFDTVYLRNLYQSQERERRAYLDRSFTLRTVTYGAIMADVATFASALFRPTLDIAFVRW
jgi:hypothetical protein